MSKAPDFSYTAAQIRGLAAAATSRLEDEIKAIAVIPVSRRTFSNTVLAFERALDRFLDMTQIPRFMALVSPDKEVRLASEELRVKTGKYSVELLTREDLFRAFSEYAGKKEKLSPVNSRLLEKRMLDFKNNGLGLETGRKNKVRKLLTGLVSLTMEFTKNLREVSDELEVTEEEMKGLPEDYKARLRRSKNGGYLVTMSLPDYNTFMENAENEDVRRRLFALFNNRCARKNTRLLEKALVMRRELANLLGYPTYADYVLAERMAGSKANVDSFLTRLQRKLAVKARRELKALQKIKGGDARIMGAWETPYYFNQLKKNSYSVDHEKIKEYFPLERVLAGMVGEFEPLLGVSFVKAKLPVWHKDVRAYEVRDAKGWVIAYFYLDLFPREGKYKHAVCSSFRESRKLPDGGRVLPVAAIIANFAPPAGGRQPLLRFNEVYTLFHEFGHVAQLLLAKADYTRLSPICAAWDFVEIPSTTFQQWTFEPAVLRRISGHYSNPGKKLPKEAIRNLVAARQADSGMYYLRMIALSKIDMAFHSARGRPDTAHIYEKLYESVVNIDMPKGAHPAASIGHLMSGYPAGYYGYIWAEVIAADIFRVFKAAGSGMPRVGKKYREQILEPAASSDENGLVKKFLGRPFLEKYFLDAIGAA